MSNDQALYDAVNRRSFDLAYSLLADGADVGYRDNGAFPNTGLTALHWAAFYGELRLVRALVERGADIDARDGMGRTPLVCAALTGHAPVVGFLLERGADVAAMAYPGWTLIPESDRSADVVDLLRRHGHRGGGESASGSTNERSATTYRDTARDRPDSTIDYPDFLAGVRHQELYSVLVHRVALLLQGMPDELVNAYASNVTAAGEALSALGLTAELIAPFERAAADLLGRSGFREAVEAGMASEELAELASRHQRALDRAMGRIRETLPRDSSLRYTAGIHVGSACFQSTMILSLARVFPPELLSAARASHAQVLVGGALHARANIRLYLGTGSPTFEDMPSYLQCLLMMIRHVEADPSITDDTGSAVLTLARDLYDYLRYRSLSIDTVLHVRLCHDRRLVEFLDTAARHSDESESAARRALSAYSVTGDGALLDEAVKLAHAEADADRQDPVALAIRSNVLGGALWERFINRGAVSDLDQSIALVERVLPWFCDTPLESSVRNNLGLALEHRFTLSGDRSALDRSIEELTRAAYPTFPLPQISPTWRHNLGNALRTRYAHLREPGDLLLAIVNLQRALDFTPADSPDLPLHRHSLANVLADRFRLRGDPADIDRAIDLYRSSVAGLDDTSPDFPKFLGNFARALQARSGSCRVEADREEAFEAFRRAVHAGSGIAAGHSLQTALAWGEWAFAMRDWEEAAAAFDQAMQLSDDLHEMQLSRAHKEDWLRSTQGLAANAAFARLRLGEAREAVAVLERGVGRLIRERLDLDGVDPDRLRGLGRGDLAERYLRVVGQLEMLDGATDVGGLAGRRPGVLRDRRDARRELASILAEIDAVTGGKGHRRTAGDVPGPAPTGPPMVYVAATAQGGIALLRDGRDREAVTGLPLPGLDLEAVIDQIVRLRSRGHSTDVWIDDVGAVCRWLWDSAMAPVLDALENERHVVLIPCGPVALLPLHAAWTPDPARSGGRRYAGDDIVITYAPNARTLAGERQGDDSPDIRRILVVHSPANTGLPDIPMCEVEAQSVVAGFDVMRVLEGESAARRQVLDELPTCDVAHFGCHGTADLLDPLRSSLCLAEGEALTVEDLLGARLRNLRLVVLSACETNVAGQKLPDEVVSLSTGLLQAGAASVLSTLWPVTDVSTAMLMDRFYQLWRREGRKPPEALGLAQRWLRETTYAGFLSYYEQALRTTARVTTPSRCAARFIDELRSMERSGGESRPFAAPFYWAAFQWNGNTVCQADTGER